MKPYRFLTNRRSDVLMDDRDAWVECGVATSSEVHEAILPRLVLPEGAYAHRAVWFFRDYTQEKETQVKHWGHMVGLYDPFADVVVISYKPRVSRTSP